MKSENLIQRNVARVAAAVLLWPVVACFSQAPPPSVQDEVRRLSDAMNRVQSQIDESQRELTQMRRELAALQGSNSVAPPPSGDRRAGADAAQLSSAVAEMQDTQAMHSSQIATLEQTKVESESKYPLRLSGMVLMTGFVNTQRVDSAVEPAVALHGPGSTTATLRQTVLGLDARGPHLFGATSHADARIDFAGGDNAGYGGSAALGIPRLRTAHAKLDWEHTNAYFALDKPLINPDSPDSLTAIAQPALAWSGNLWAWNPQGGVSHDFTPALMPTFRVQAALIDVADPPPLYTTNQITTYTPPSTAEMSRWPGTEARIALVGAEGGAHFGASGFFAPHRIPGYASFDSWAAALDFNTPVTRYTQLTANAYRGLALGGVGGGAYKDFVARFQDGELYIQALDDVGGWAQWKQRAGGKLEFNEAFGIDNVPAHQLRPFAVTSADSYFNLARNRTITGNVIYSPSAYLVFSLEYRRIASSFVNSPTEFSDIVGLAAGYKF
jgi:hypothetical protein